MFKLKKLMLLFVVLLSFDKIHAQGIEEALVKYSNNAAQEKVYVQFDNSIYLAGQTIWYKAYIMKGYQPSSQSRNFYVDWFDEYGKVISTSITPIVSSASAGHFDIPESYKGHKLHAIAYTKWMRNFDSTYFFEKSFRIINNDVKTVVENNVYKDTKIVFLPESGNLIADNDNIVAFKAINNLGLPESINGVIINKKGDTIASFRTVHDGMGRFQFSPKAEQIYTAIWKDKIGNLHKTPLPAINPAGVILNIESGATNRVFYVQRSKIVPNNLKQLTLVGQMNGNVLFMSNLDLTNKEFISGKLPLNKMLTGILQLTVFNAENMPVCERLVFVKNEEYKLKTAISLDTINTSKRGKNIYEISLTDSSYTNLSLSITDANFSDLIQNNIYAQLLLNGELGGKVYKPAYYFSSNADSVNNHLDLVMLTNGWRRYDWKLILADTNNKAHYMPDSSYQNLRGMIVEYASRKPKKQEMINLIFVARDSSNTMLTLPINEDGSFFSNNTLLFDTTKVYYKIIGKNANNKIIFENNLREKPPVNFFEPYTFILDSPMPVKLDFNLTELQQSDTINKNNYLKEVVVYSKQQSRLKELDKKYAFGMLSGQATAAFDMSTLQNSSHSIDVYDFLDGKVPGLQFSSTEGGTGSRVAEYRNGKVSFYLNGSYINEKQVESIEMSTVAYIKVFSPPAISGPNGSGGAIAIYTKIGVDNNSRDFIPNGLDYKLYSGYTGNKEFYSPIYAEKSIDDKKDTRTTLLWNPWIFFDKQHQKVKVEFYNNDYSKAFNIVLEGMDNRGKLISIQKLVK
jgi:hypothetical protein